MEVIFTFYSVGAQIELLCKLRRQYQSGELSSQELDEILENYCIYMVDPATGGTPFDGGILSEVPLCSDGDTILVTADTLDEYFDLLADSWFGEVSTQGSSHQSILQ